MARIIGFSSTLKYCLDELQELLDKEGHELLIGPDYSGVPTEDEVAEMLGEFLPTADAILLGGAVFTRGLLEKVPNIKTVARAGVGFDAVDLEATAERGVPVTITIHANADTVADFAMTMMLALTRKLITNHSNLSSGDWTRAIGSDFYGKTLGIAGLGRIGRAVAIRARAFGMKVLGHELYPNAEFVREHEIELVDLDRLCRESDFISLHMPPTPETENCINAERLAMMKPTAYLVNTARGPLIDEPALLAALTDGTIAGAGLDVFEVEPLSESPFFGLDNTIVTPHVAGISEGANQRMIVQAAKNILAVLSGEWPRDIVVNGVYSD
ncbi:MAG: phosphoglycerate dehydrogenase [Chloroflexota bacterium]|nr:phosphoglycerate dehydrogenase [Chloroflexota bacterium]MDP6756913.1 phosphoglycerate dehydrogenase [Chloroflexota bacterium]